jgi:hypothetical protein
MQFLEFFFAKRELFDIFHVFEKTMNFYEGKSKKILFVSLRFINRRQHLAIVN